MLTLLRRLFWLGLLGGAGYAGWAMWQRQATPAPAAAPEWPPLPPLHTTSSAAEEPTAADESPTTTDDRRTDDRSTDDRRTDDRRWVEPVDGACPDGYPIKANDKSGIYHVPGGRFYARTVPERCYADTDAAEADGYRAAKA